VVPWLTSVLAPIMSVLAHMRAGEVY
jgi:hypothetical protein